MTIAIHRLDVIPLSVQAETAAGARLCALSSLSSYDFVDHRARYQPAGEYYVIMTNPYFFQTAARSVV